MTHTPDPTHPANRPAPTLPTAQTDKVLLGALLLATGVGGWAQTAGTAAPAATLSTVVIEGQDTVPSAKHSLRATQTRIGKGTQDLRDIPQTVTVMTERLMDDRNLDDLRQVLKTTSGVTFLAGETGEEDVRLRGFSLAQAGDLYVDGLRDVPMTERDTFNFDRVEVLKGSASMLFGKGSTGGVVNQVSKAPFLMTQHEVNTTVGTGNEWRVTGDFNLKTDENAALRINLLRHSADQAGALVDKRGVAPTYRWNIGLRDEFSVGLYHLETDGRPLYSHPQLVAGGVIQPRLDARHYYGMASDYLRTRTQYATLGHTHRLSPDSQVRTVLRHGHYERDLLGSANRFGTTGGQPTTLANLSDATVILRSPKGRRSESDITQLQSDYDGKFQWGGRTHALIAGIDLYHEDALRNTNTITGSGLSNPPTTVGTPNDGLVSTGLATRPPVAMAHFKAQSAGAYVQDTASLSQTVKLVAGLRVDRFEADYRNLSQQAFRMGKTLWSPRIGALWQPDARTSYYTSLGESYNMQGDTYQWTPSAASGALSGNNLKWLNTPPEKSRNLEVGGKFNVFENKALLGVAFFHSEKFNERNLDEPTADNYLLSGKRHASGIEFHFAGRITPLWELFYNHTWIPEARIDEGRAQGSKPAGSRPGLTPKHSASLWTTYRVAPQWRLGGGLNHRSRQTTLVNENTAAAFTTVDAMVEHTLGEHASVKLSVSNLTDRRYADGLYTSFYTPGAPRTVQLSLKTVF